MPYHKYRNKSFGSRPTLRLTYLRFIATKKYELFSLTYDFITTRIRKINDVRLSNHQMLQMKYILSV